MQGRPAYEMKPRINNILFYIKVALVELGNPDERMLLISVHPDQLTDCRETNDRRENDAHDEMPTLRKRYA